MGLRFLSRIRLPSVGAVHENGRSRDGRAAAPAAPDLYEVLGVPRHATPDEIRFAYRRQAAPLIDRWFLPGRAERKLATLNAAYEILGNPARRAQYDIHQVWSTQHGDQVVIDPEAFAAPPVVPPADRHVAGRRKKSRRIGTGFLEIIAIVFVVALALGTASWVISSFSPNLSVVMDLTETLGLTPRRRAATAPGAKPQPTTQTTPTAAVPGLSTVMPSPTTLPPTGVERYAGTQVDLSDPNPRRRSDLTVTLRLRRDNAPVPGALVYLIAHYRTLDERWPQGASTVRTDSDGMAPISFNVGDATAGYPVPLEVFVLLDGQQFVWRSQFIPR